MTQDKIDLLEETVLRLHEHLRKFEHRGTGFEPLMSKLRKKGGSRIDTGDKEMATKWGEYQFYKGKLFAYIFVLEQLGAKEVPALIQRLRGFKREGNVVIETKKGYLYPIPSVTMKYIQK